MHNGGCFLACYILLFANSDVSSSPVSEELIDRRISVVSGSELAAFQEPSPVQSEGAEMPRLLHEIFEQNSRNSSSAVAIEHNGSQVTYGELEKRSNSIACLLRASGIGRGSVIGIMLPRVPDAFASMLGAMKVGACYVPLDTAYPSERVSYILRDSGAHALITLSHFADNAADFKGKVFLLDKLERQPDGLPLDAPQGGGNEICPEDLCYIIYTSGTTGRPKGVKIEHRNAVALVRAESTIYRLGGTDRVCQAASLAFDLSFEEIWIAFSSCATLVVVPEVKSHGGPDMADFLSENGVTVLSTVPSLLSTLNDRFEALRLLILGGERCPDWVTERWSRPGRRILNTYGPTETTVIATYSELKIGEKAGIGVPIPGYSVYIVDEDLNPVARPGKGEICIGGAGVARGYVNLPEETASRFITDPFSSQEGARMYRTGDIGRLGENGSLEFVGRIDSQVKFMGYRIELSEIESALVRLEGIRAAVCNVWDDRLGTKKLVGYFVPDDGVRLDRRKLRNALQKSLPRYMVPSVFVQMDNLPLLSSGKIDRSSLPPPPEHGEQGRRSEEQVTSTQKRLLEVWADLFNPLEVGLNDDFFLDLGGHSLLAARMVSLLRQEEAFERLSVADIYENPTIRLLAVRVDERNSQQSKGWRQTASAGPSINSAKPKRHLLGSALQTIGLYFSFGFRAIEWITPYLVFFTLIVTGHPLFYSMILAALSGIVVLPALLGISLAAKWTLLGRIRPGRYPLWGGYYLRWWLVQSLISSLPLDYLEGTPLLPAVYRLFGAKIGAEVHLETDRLRSFDLIEIGDGTSVDEDASLLGYSVENGELVIGSITIGKWCYVGARSVVREGAKIEDGGRLDDISLLQKGRRIPSGETWVGSPARPANTRHQVPRPSPVRTRRSRRLLPFLYATLVLSLPVLVFAAILPGVIVLLSLNFLSEPLLYIAAVPLAGAFFVLAVMSEFLIMKWALLGRVKAGSYRVHSGFYIRHWIVDRMHSLTLDFVAPIHATLYIGAWYRALGSKIGRSVELSTATSLTPDLLYLGEGCTVADEVSLGAPHVEAGWMTLAPTMLGRRTFVGNSAVIPAGTVTPPETLLGVLSTPPSQPGSVKRHGTSWLGSPPIELPRREKSTAFSNETTYSPSKKLRIKRAMFEILRVTIPPSGFIALTTFVLDAVVLLWRNLGFVPAALMLPLVYAGGCVALALCAAAAKWALVGRYSPFEKPLWSLFVWKLELANALYEFMSTPLALEPLQGTPFLPAYQRLMGASIGRGVYMHTTGLLEWDLTRVGSGVSLNEDCVLQTHLFEDRVLKGAYLTIGESCDVGEQSIVLYGAEMEPGSSLDALSLLMKGERLPAGTSWAGVPAGRGADQIRILQAAD